MFRKMRRTKNEIPLEAAKELLRKNKRGALAVLGDERYPFAVPINFFYDEEENRLYFHSAKTGHKMDAMKANDKVCFTTWDDGYLVEGDWAYHVSSCVVFGRARLVEDQQLAKEKIRRLGLKYYPGSEEVEQEIEKAFRAVQVVAIDIEHISGKKIHER